MPSSRKNEFYNVLKAERQRYDLENVVVLFAATSKDRVTALAARLFDYISVNLPAAFAKRSGLAAYRSNPYVLMTSASVMKLDDPKRFADFLFNTKLYMALETSFGKSVEAACLEQHPFNSEHKWAEPPEKLAEFAALAGLNLEDRASLRTQSVWREIDKSVVVGSRRYMTSIKSGPNTINDTQVQAMTAAIIQHHAQWAQQSRETYPGVNELDIVIGLTYGTNHTTNNKENQILVKLLAHGFEEEDRATRPGVLIDQATRSIRVYRRVGMDFWAFVGDPADPGRAGFVFLEILLALAKALAAGVGGTTLEDRINAKILELSSALATLQFPRNSLPEWIRQEFNDDQLFWFATAITAFYDEGI